MEKYQLYTGGKFIDAETGETRATINPATEEPIALVPVATRGDTRRAIESARSAFDSRVWSGMPVKERARILMRIVEKLAERQDELARIEAADAGATIRKTSMMDIPIGIEHFRALVELGERIPSYEPLPWIDMPAISWNFVNREPIGVCAGIIPWNFPFMMAVWKIAPALIMGNTLVLKPATDTPLTALEIARTAAECGLPPGVLNVVIGSGSVVGEELCTNPMVDKVALTGSTETGQARDEARLRHGEEGHPRAGRQEPDHHLRRCRPLHRGGRHAVRHVLPRGAGLRVGHPLLRARLDL